MVRVKSAGFTHGNSASFYVDGKIQKVVAARGLTVAYFKSIQGKLQLEKSGTFDTYGDQRADDQLAAFIKSIPAGRVVAIASKDSAHKALRLS